MFGRGKRGSRVSGTERDSTVSDAGKEFAELVMGKTNMMPVAIVKGYQYDKNNDSINNIIREKDFDLFR